MSKVIPPLCLLLSLLMFIAGFALLAVEPPEAGTDLHRARVEGDEQSREVLEDKLQKDQHLRNFLIGTLFVSGVLSTFAAFFAMRPTHPR